MRDCVQRPSSPLARTAACLLALCLLGACSGGGSSGGTGANTGDDTGDDTEGGATQDIGAGTGAPGPSSPGAGEARPGAANPALTQSQISRQIFHTDVEAFVVQAYYEDGAEPYTGRLGLSTNDTWDITLESYSALFSAHAGRTVSVPSTLAQMQRFDDQGIQDWSIQELVALGESMRQPLTAGTDVNVSIVFVNGLYEGNAGVLGIHPTNSPFAFVFKDVVRSVGGDAMTQRYVEQATVVHEIGHTVGFVDNGIPMVNDHDDAAHPHHTTDEDGVMYWAVESSGGSLAFATSLITGATLQLFGPASLLDAHNYQPRD